MRSIEVVSPGLLTSVQDLGRFGFGPLGISVSGAADALSLRVGNRIVGNPENAAALEMTLIGGAFRFTEGAVIALSGSDFDPVLGAAPVPGQGSLGENKASPVKMWRSVKIQPGQMLRLAATRSGARCYFCVRGGVQIEPFLGSASAHLLSGLGGFQGRALRAGDVLQIGAAASTPRARLVNPELLEQLSPRKMLRVTPGPQSDWFSAESLQRFYSTAYRVSEESNRMGLRLMGEQTAMKAPREMVTEGVALGAIQIPANGQPIILSVEQQTTGGYPKIANIISADFHSLGQLRPRDEIRFEQVSFETARSLLLEQENLLASDRLIIDEAD